MEISRMKDRREAEVSHWSGLDGEEVAREIRRANAKLRHFRGIAASVMKDAFGLWEEIWEGLQDRRSCEEILDGSGAPCSHLLEGERIELLEKLHLLGIQIDYARRLCEGAVEDESHNKGEL
jgi:hypothetical protein